VLERRSSTTATNLCRARLELMIGVWSQQSRIANALEAYESLIHHARRPGTRRFLTYGLT
jgi:hypothetical protein